MDITLLLLFPWGGWVSVVPHILYLITFLLISILYNSNSCHVSFFSVSSAKQAWWIAFLMKWQPSSLNISDLVCFVFRTYAPERQGGFVVLCLIYVYTGALICPSVSTGVCLGMALISSVNLSFHLFPIQACLILYKSFIITMKQVWNRSQYYVSCLLWRFSKVKKQGCIEVESVCLSWCSWCQLFSSLYRTF